MADASEVSRPLLVFPYGVLGGSEQVLLRVIGALGPDFAPRAVVMAEGPLADMVRERGVPTDVVPLPGKQGIRRFRPAARELAAKLDGERISLVHANGIKAAVFAMPLARRLGVPLVWMKHDHVMDGLPGDLVAGRCSAVICVSEAMRRTFRPRLRGKVSVAYPGVDLPSAVEPVGEQLLIAAVGRLDPAKGFDDLLRATAALRRSGIPARITVAGPVDRVHPGHAAELAALVEQLGLQEHASVGWVDDLKALYDEARVVALASRPRPNGRPGEGAPIVLLEGMAHGRPVVAPREGGISELVGDAGTLVDEPSAELLAAAIAPYLSDRALAAEVGARGARRVRDRFTLARTVEVITGVYAGLASARSGDRTGG